MRLREADKTKVTIREPDNANNDDRTYKWVGGTPIMAVHQPLSSSIAAQVYGEKVQRMRLLLYDGSEPLVEGLGVCLYVEPDASCDYRIVSVEGWASKRCMLEFIPEALRAL